MLNSESVFELDLYIQTIHTTGIMLLQKQGKLTYIP